MQSHLRAVHLATVHERGIVDDHQTVHRDAAANGIEHGEVIGLGHQPILVGDVQMVVLGPGDVGQLVHDRHVHRTGADDLVERDRTAATAVLVFLDVRAQGPQQLPAVGERQAANFAGKIVIDVTNPLKDGPNGPELAIGFSDSGGETVQRLLPAAKVVKAWNHVPAALMVSPHLLGETADMFICGNDAAAKQKVTIILKAFGCPVIDLGGIEQARLTEALTGLWIRYMVISGNWQHAFKLIRKD